jgi:sulfide:quinone oxidoreductase
VIITDALRWTCGSRTLTEMSRVLVLGGGFGGIATAVALRFELGEEHDVTLVDRRDEFVMGLRKTWHVLGISPLAYGERALALLRRRGIDHVQGEIEAIDVDERRARVDGTWLSADAMVLALGAMHAPEAVPGLKEHGFDAWTQEGLEHVSAAVTAFRGGRAVIGIFGAPYSCPPAPYELALLLADRLQEREIDGEITVFAPFPITLPILGPDGSTPLDRRLADREIDFLPGRVASAVEAGRVLFADGPELPFDLLLAVPPHRAPSVLVDAGLAPQDGWVAVDPRTLETPYPDVYAIGDCTVIGLANGMAMPKAGIFAQREGEVVAGRIAARLRGEEPTATFDGSGSCFVEMGGGEASLVGGQFLGETVRASLGEPSTEQRAAKERFEADRLTAWFGG